MQTHKPQEKKKDNRWHDDPRYGNLLCKLFGHILFKPSPNSEIEQCKACYGWRYQ